MARPETGPVPAGFWETGSGGGGLLGNAGFGTERASLDGLASAPVRTEERMADGGGGGTLRAGGGGGVRAGDVVGAAEGGAGVAAGGAGAAVAAGGVGVAGAGAGVCAAFEDGASAEAD